MELVGQTMLSNSDKEQKRTPAIEDTTQRRWRGACGKSRLYLSYLSPKRGTTKGTAYKGEKERGMKLDNEAEFYK